ncbi:hypothetical protein MTR67_036687 [Solanum verrucosum]|uniref:DUF4283 domain-containing protein n=1 Tax=Solanum verrucosum TaxID=315347 RepID=A0AAF0UC82_SOLVR|nr:hypothetical protein MTR67_036687 [Solanum verrucosum]
MLHGEPNITWKGSEVKALIIQENLQYAIIGKFSYGKPDITELRRTLPGQCGIKSECVIGVLDTRHILIRLTNLEDYVHLLSATAFYVKAKDNYWQMRTFKWDPWFEPDVETTIGVAWISFPDLPPHFFAKEAIFSIAAAVGKPLMVDMATRNQTRPSCAKVKIEVDLMAKLPQRVRIMEEDDDTGSIKSKWIKVQYDYMPKYCKECCLQGHDEYTCWALHPELYENNSNEHTKKEEVETDNTNKRGEQSRTLTSGKIVGYKQNKQEWMVRRINKYKRDKYGHVEGENDMRDVNPFAALQEEEEQETTKEIKDKEGSTKDWVNKSFNNQNSSKKDQEKQKRDEIPINIHEEIVKEKEEIKEERMQQDEKEEGEVIEDGKFEEERYRERIGREGEKPDNYKTLALVVYEDNNDEVLPLANDDTKNDDYEGHEHAGGNMLEASEEGIMPLSQQEALENNMEHRTLVRDKEDLMQNIENAARRGDLSPKQKSKIQEAHTKVKKIGEGELQAAQASSRSKRTIIKNTRYQ